MNEVAVQPENGKKVTTIPQLIDSYKDEIAKALPRHLTPDRMTRIVMTEFRKIAPYIANNLDPLSFIGAVVQAAQLGLEPGSGLGQCYLIPYKNGKRSKELGRDVYEIQLITGYRGKVQLARNSKEVLSIGAYIIRENDTFEHSFGADEKPIHKPPKLGEDRGKMIGVWADAKLVDGGYQKEILTVEDVEKARKSSRSGNRGPWVDHYEEMAKKTAIHRLSKLLPASSEIRASQNLEELIEKNVSQNHQLLLNPNLESNWSPMDDAGSMMHEMSQEQNEKLRLEKVDELTSAVKSTSETLGHASYEPVLKKLDMENLEDIGKLDLKSLDACLDVVNDMVN